jgi:hypothetical protein
MLPLDLRPRWHAGADAVPPAQARTSATVVPTSIRVASAFNAGDGACLTAL